MRMISNGTIKNISYLLNELKLLFTDLIALLSLLKLNTLAYNSFINCFQWDQRFFLQIYKLISLINYCVCTCKCVYSMDVHDTLSANQLPERVLLIWHACSSDRPYTFLLYLLNSFNNTTSMFQRQKPSVLAFYSRRPTHKQKHFPTNQKLKVYFGSNFSINYDQYFCLKTVFYSQIFSTDSYFYRKDSNMKRNLIWSLLLLQIPSLETSPYFQLL